jgi:acyl-coenzyme A synthetase/AMP-(fatty) acid ligase
MNICEFIDENGIKYPNKKAVVLPKNDIYSEFYTFKVFKEKTHQMAHYFSEKGIQRGHKVLVFIKPSLDSTAVVFALFRIGAVPVLMDPGMGLRNLLNSIKQCQPEALIGEPIVFLMSYVLRDAFKSVKIKLKLKSLTGSSHSLHKHLLQFDKDYKSANMNKDEMGAILFTSGGTGIPKGVVYTQEIFKAQTLKLKEMFELTPIDIDLPGFPLFSLFTLAIGMTSVIPQMDPSRPARCNPRKLVENIQNHRTTFIAGSPAIWSRVADYCIKENIQLETVKYLVMFGAPVSIELHENLKKYYPMELLILLTVLQNVFQ